MAFLDHIDPGNAVGSVLIPEVKPREVLPPVMPLCSICQKRFANKLLLDEHTISEHPVKRPMLLINGESLRRDNVTVRARIYPESITFTDVDEMYVNDIKISSEDELKSWLCNSNPLSFKLKLVNMNYPVEYRWNIDIAEADELDRVDRDFYSTFSNGLDLVASLSLFNEAIKGLSSAAKNYAAGLSCYVVSVVTKDQLPGASLDFESYNNKLGEAMDILIDYNGRLLADAILSISVFMQNDFSMMDLDVDIPKLKVTKHFFNSGSFISSEEVSNNLKTIPIDMATDMITKFCSSPIEWRAINVDTIESLLKCSSTDSRDRIKSIFILWCHYRQIGDAGNANKLRGKLIHNPFFGQLVEVLELMKNE